jgi:peptidoglycan/LPS O-acetylase OafA/YrhL
MSLETQNNKRIFGLDFVRASAIVLVLFSHIYYLIDSSNPLLISISGLFGFLGVELFFVLSGFLIGSILLDHYLEENFNWSSVKTFLKRRWYRTLPNYFLLFFINLLIAFWLNYDISDIWRYLFFIQNIFSYHITFYAESWSLSIEEWTYLFAPLLLLMSKYLFKNRKKIGYIVTVLFIILFIHLVRYLNFTSNQFFDMNTWNTELKSVVLFRLDVVFFGFILAWLHYYYQQFLKRLSVYFFIVAIHLFFLQYFVLNALGFDIVSKPLYFHVFYFTLSSITISLAMPVFIFWKTTQSFALKPITFLSKISYSLYLFHYSVMIVIIKNALAYLSIQLSDLQLIILYFTLTFTASIILYIFYEKPMMDLRDKI